MKKQLQNLAVLGTSTLASSGAFAAAAAAVDVADVTGTIANQLVPIGLVGAAVILLIVVVKAYKWIRRAF